MIRGTTPTLDFHLNIDVTTITKADISFAQNGDVIFSKSLSDCTVISDMNILRCSITETESLLLDSDKEYVSVQLRIGVGTQRYATPVYTLPVSEILKDGALS